MSEWIGDAAKGLAYRVLGRLINRPSLLAFLVRVAQSTGVTVAWRYAELDDICRRPNDFSNRAHAPQLIAGDFVIGMDSGPRQVYERDAASCPLPTPTQFGSLAAAESRNRIQGIAAQLRSGEPFDLVNDYLVFVVWRALSAVFDASSIKAIEGVGPGVPPDAAKHILFRELRYIGANLIVGGSSPRRVLNTALACAAALNERVRRAQASIKSDWAARCPAAAATFPRQAVGLMWVGHPATVQAGAFVFQELRQRSKSYALLRERVQRCAVDPYSDADTRDLVRAHVLECLRLRPPFPLLPRLLPRSARVSLGRKPRVAEVDGGKSISMAIVAALRDPAVVEAPECYVPQRTAKIWNDSPDKLPIFGDATRACIARHQAVECLVSAFIGLLGLPELEWADSVWDRIVYEGPVVVRMRLRSATRAAGAGSGSRP